MSGCASTARQIGDNRYNVSCGGILNGWSSCYEAANSTCVNGIEQLDRKQIDHPPQWNTACACYLNPVDRYLVFACR